MIAMFQRRAHARNKLHQCLTKLAMLGEHNAQLVLLGELHKWTKQARVLDDALLACLSSFGGGLVCV